VSATNLVTVRREVLDHVRFTLDRLVPGMDGTGAGAEPRDRVPAREVVDLWSRAVELSGDACLGLRAALSVAPGTFGLLGTVVATRRSLAEALVENARLLPLVTDSVGFSLVVRARRAQYVLEVRDPALLHPQSAEQIVATVWFWVRDVAAAAGVELDAVIRFAHERADPSSDHELLLGSPVRFMAGLNAIELSTTALFEELGPFVFAPQDGPDPVMEADRQLDLARGAGSPFLSLVRQAVREELPTGATEATVSRRIGLHPRTLSRRLTARGTTFRSIVDNERLERARQLLVTEGSIDHIARQLGYSDGSAFSRAFKRWTGTSPTAFRLART
jgi:AraC-like DNA-binding protein